MIATDPEEMGRSGKSPRFSSWNGNPNPKVACKGECAPRDVEIEGFEHQEMASERVQFQVGCICRVRNKTRL